MSQEIPQVRPFYSTSIMGKEYFLCVKHENDNDIYFFTTQVDNLKAGQRQTELPSGYKVSTERGMPIVIKKPSE